MEGREREELVLVLTDVYELYGKECSRGLHALWWEALKGYSITEVRGALSGHVTNPDSGQFLPKPADIRRNLEGSSETRALQAWTKVDQATRRIGPWESVAFDDPIIHAVLADMGGWTALGQVTEDEWPFKRNEFVRRYQGYVARPPTAFPRALTGYVAEYNGRLGGPAPLPRLVGDPQRATQAYLAGADTTHRYPRLAADVVKEVAAHLNAPARVPPAMVEESESGGVRS